MVPEIQTLFRRWWLGPVAVQVPRCALPPGHWLSKQGRGGVEIGDPLEDKLPDVSFTALTQLDGSIIERHGLAL